MASGRYVHTLHAPAKGGPLAVVQDWERGDGGRLTALYTPAKARAIREAERTRSREHQAAYREARGLAGRRLAKGLGLRYWPGQEWGTVELPGHIRTEAPRVVSARGALRAAGLTREEAEKLLADSWEKAEIRYDSHGPQFTLSLHGIEVGL